MAKADSTTQSGRFAYDGLDRVIHEKARLSVLTSLVTHPKGLVFGDLKEMCGLTDGNLSRHLQVLEEAGLIDIQKGYDHNRPQTLCRITAAGPAALSRLPAGARADRARCRRRDRCERAAARAARRKTGLNFFAEGLYDAKYSCQTSSACRHHHGRQRALGDAARAAAHSRPSRGHSHRAARGRGGARSRCRRAQPVRVFLRQLATPRGRGARPDGAVAPLCARGMPAADRGRRAAHGHRPARPAAVRSRRGDRRGRAGLGTRRAARSAHRDRLFGTRQHHRVRRPPGAHRICRHATRSRDCLVRPARRAAATSIS